MIAIAGKLIIEIQNQDDAFIPIDVPSSEGFIIGRSDNLADFVPDIDLAPYGARQFGVSRRHAVIVQFKQAVHIVDLGSVNGTFVNEVQLQPHMPTALQSGDFIRIGSLIAIITHFS